jgi:hypothetical protein
VQPCWAQRAARVTIRRQDLGLGAGVAGQVVDGGDQRGPHLGAGQLAGRGPADQGADRGGDPAIEGGAFHDLVEELGQDHAREVGAQRVDQAARRAAEIAQPQVVELAAGRGQQQLLILAAEHRLDRQLGTHALDDLLTEAPERLGLGLVHRDLGDQSQRLGHRGRRRVGEAEAAQVGCGDGVAEVDRGGAAGRDRPHGHGQGHGRVAVVDRGVSLGQGDLRLRRRGPARALEPAARRAVGALGRQRHRGAGVGEVVGPRWHRHRARDRVVGGRVEGDGDRRAAILDQGHGGAGVGSARQAHQDLRFLAAGRADREPRVIVFARRGARARGGEREGQR